jgi:hypothetical protein
MTKDSESRYRYETIDGKLHTFVRVTEPGRRFWWQFWRPRWVDREYRVEAFSGKMTPAEQQP